MNRLCLKTAVLTAVLVWGCGNTAHSAQQLNINREEMKNSQQEMLGRINDLLTQVEDLSAAKVQLDRDEKVIRQGISLKKADSEAKEDARQEEEELRQWKEAKAAAEFSQPASKIEDKIDQILLAQSEQDRENPSPETQISEPLSDQDAGHDYWSIDVRDQTVEDINRNHMIDEAFRDAKNLMVEEKILRNQKAAVKDSPTKEKQPAVSTPRQIIRSVIKENLIYKKVDLDFENSNLSDILLTLGKTAELNIVLDPVLKNNQQDLHLKKVTIEEALLLIADSNDLGFKRVDGSLYITKRDKLRNQNLVSRLIKLRNISVEEAKSLILNLIDKVNISESINSLIIVGDPEDIVKVEKIIENIDQPQPQVVLEAKIIEVNKDALKDLGVDWSDQVIISYQETARPVDLANVEDAPQSLGKIQSFSRNPIQFDTIIKFLENQNDAKILSNPRITTLNNKEAEIFVGDRVPYTITNVTGGVVTTDVRWVEPGIRLIITPTIIEDDFVVLKVEPEVSFIFAFRGPNDEFPQVKTREATAYVRVKNNQPFILGGLLNQEDKRNLFKVPLLGDIPWLGNLFSYETHTILDTELIITVTPTIVQGDL